MATKPAAKSRRRRPKAKVKQTTTHGPVSKAEYYSKAIGRALDVLDCFRDGETCLGLMELSARLKFPESSLFRTLLTLESHGYLVRAEDGPYRLAPKLLFGKLHERALQIRDIVHPFLKALNTRFNETASLGFIFQDRIEVIDTLEAIHEIRRTNTLGRVLPPHCSSLGKAIVAFQKRPVIDRILRVNGISSRTKKTLTDHAALLDDFENVRRKGYSVDREESVVGGVCFGAPVRDEHGIVIAAVSMSTPIFRLNPKKESEIIRAVVDTGRKASEAIAESATAV